MNPYYFMCMGSVRGRCKHKHRTIAGANRCLRRDKMGCAMQGGYSDRILYKVEILSDSATMAYPVHQSDDDKE